MDDQDRATALPPGIRQGGIPRVVPADATLFEQGQPVVAVFYVRTGAVVLSREDEDGERETIAEVGPGGRVALLDDATGRHTATARARRRSSILFLPLDR